MEFDCGTGEVDIIPANWGANVGGFEFKDISIARANDLRKHFGLDFQTKLALGNINDYSF